MLNVNLGGFKGFTKFSEEIRANWKTLDVDPKADYVHDLNFLDPLPFEDNTVDNYYASMILEHVLPKYQTYVFNEIYRTLKPGGRIRIVVPDFKKGIDAYLKGDIRWLSSSRQPTPDSNFPNTLLGKFMGWFYTEERDKKGAIRHGHNMVYDWQTLQLYLIDAKFQKIALYSYNNGSEIFKGKDFERYREFGLYAEAIK